MTTVVNPGASPTVVYNRSGTTILTITGIGLTLIPFPIISERTVIQAFGDQTDSGNCALQLPVGADIGDSVEVYAQGVSGGYNPSITVTAGAGETIQSNPAQVASNDGGGSLLLRKLTSTNWGVLGSPV